MVDPRIIARLPLIKARFQRAMNMQLVLDASGFQFRLPGFKYDDFDRAGHLSAHKLNRLMETSRFSDVGALALEPQSSSTLFYLLGSHLTCSLELYQRAALMQSLVYESRPVRVGKTSIDISQALYEDSSNCAPVVVVPTAGLTYLASRVFRCVSVDKQTKRPTAIPENVREVVTKAIGSLVGAEQAGLPTPDLPSVAPPYAFCWRLVPRFDDLDWFFHVNQGSYLGYALECAARASLAGAYPHFTGDICFRHVSSAACVHSAESFPDDELTVLTWEDPQDSCALFFIMKKGELVAYRARLLFHPATD